MIDRSYKACIFDLDGTLLDSMGVWRYVDEVFLGKRGLPFTEEYARAVSFMKLNLAADYTVELFGLDEKPEDIIKEWLDLARHEFTYNIQPKPYGVEYIRLLKEKNIPIAVATSSQKELYMPALKRIGIFELFDVIMDSDKIDCGKDKPDIFVKTALALGVKPEECLVFEDTVNGILSAKSAGFVTVGFLDEHQPQYREELIKNADCTAANFKEFYEELAAQACV
ncbi:MAG: HAD family phosphatase [Ruminococcaceae bacterium]|nr:HAD family phosphatase [Oscillospiraceae bacterium]